MRPTVAKRRLAHSSNLELVLERGPASGDAMSRVWICTADAHKMRPFKKKQAVGVW